MSIRKTKMSDLDDVCRIYADARAFMRESGNPNQWKNTNPALEVIVRDIHAQSSYVYERSGVIAAVFFFSTDRDPTYSVIDGAWLNDDNYGVVHRIARTRSASGAGAICLEWCYEQCGNLRIDTHRDNAVMRNRLEKMGFSYCGIIWLENGEERLAYQKGSKGGQQ